MLTSYEDKEHPLRAYINGPIGEKLALYEKIRETYGCISLDALPGQQDDSEDSFLFWDDADPGADPDAIAFHFPRRLLPFVEKAVSEIGVQYQKNAEQLKDGFVEKVIVPKDILSNDIILRDYQVNAISAGLSYRRGILEVCTSGGKSFMSLAMIRYILDQDENNKALLCVPSLKLLDQMESDALAAGFTSKEITLIGGGNDYDLNKKLVISTVQSMIRKLDDDDIKDWKKNLKIFIMDEAHKTSARTFYQTVDSLAPEYMIGVTARAFYQNKEKRIQDMLVRGMLGSILFQVTAAALIDRGFLSRPYLITFNAPCTRPGIAKNFDWLKLERESIVNNKDRNKIIIECAVALRESDKQPLILVSKIKHGIHLCEKISYEGLRVAFLKGGQEVIVYDNGKVLEHFKEKGETIKERYTSGEIDVLVGTSVVDEGYSLPAIGATILAGGGKSPLRVTQRIGRGLRPKKNDNITIVIDFLDEFNAITKKHSAERRKVMNDLGVPEYQVPVSCNKDVRKLITSYVKYFREDNQRIIDETRAKDEALNS